MGTIVRTHTYSDGAVARPDHANKNEITLYNVINGNLDWANIKAALQNAANGFVKLDANADVPLAQIPESLKSQVPSGVIVMWSGTLATIPAGWSLCNGTGGTPDLRDKFIYGASDGVDPGGSGGATTHTHTYSDLPEHTHTYQKAFGSDPRGAGSEHPLRDDESTESTGSAGVASPETDAGSTLPPYYKLAFIMKD